MNEKSRKARKTRRNDPERRINLAAAKGDLVRVKDLLQRGTDPNASDTFDGFTALISASFHGHLNVARCLIEAGAEKDIKVTNEYPVSHEGTTALMLACLNGHTPIVRLLVETGANINLNAVDGGSTAIGFAASAGHLAIVNFLLDAGAKLPNGVLYGCVKHAHPRIVERLIAAGANISHRSSFDTPLVMTACQTPPEYLNPRRQIEVLRLLLRAGADVNTRNLGLETALMEAVLKKNVPVSLFLVSVGADVNAKSRANKTALHYAAGGPQEITDALIKAGADLNVVDCEGLKPTDVARLATEPRVIGEIREIFDKLPPQKVPKRKRRCPLTLTGDKGKGGQIAQ
jgi:ankyrin repeat protein